MCEQSARPRETADNNALDAEPPIASFLKSMLIGGGPVNAGVLPQMETSMQHPILGDITRENDHGDGVARVSYGDRKIEIRIIADEIPYDAAVDVAASLVRDLPALDSRAKQVAAAELTETYNDGWNEYDEAQADGTFKAVCNPKLTQDEFATKLTLNAVNVTGNMLGFFYDDENMFWGHTVIVNSMDGIAFTDTHAEIFG